MARVKTLAEHVRHYNLPIVICGRKTCCNLSKPRNNKKYCSDHCGKVAANIRRISNIRKRSKLATQEDLNLLGQLRPLFPIVGIYFLFKNNEIIYIGSSINIPLRVAQHRANFVDFDSVRYLKYKAYGLTKLEHRFIAHFRPKLNIMAAKQNRIFD